MNEIAAPGAREQTPLPSAYTDRSALSEAWYRALYGAGHSASRSTSPKAGANDAAGDDAIAERVRPEASAHFGRATSRAVSTAGTRQQRPVASSVAYRSRAVRGAPPTPAQRAWRAAVARRLQIDMQLPDGEHVELLVQQRGRHVHVLALSGAPSAARTEAALGRARAALMQHGIRLEIDPRLKGMS